MDKKTKGNLGHGYYVLFIESWQRGIWRPVKCVPSCVQKSVSEIEFATAQIPIDTQASTGKLPVGSKCFDLVRLGFRDWTQNLIDAGRIFNFIPLLIFAAFYYCFYFPHLFKKWGNLIG
jgi:hypothetical protein